ncbi:protein AHNAK2 [Pteropus alecto]|uniref:protein AHNAK2 n=1 Tax=Pteropus alecto TaxID=9402 RepID=UPI000D53759A|nr:protein AHNAK2 [Pteropus alecto]
MADLGLASWAALWVQMPPSQQPPWLTQPGRGLRAGQQREGPGRAAARARSRAPSLLGRLAGRHPVSGRQLQPEEPDAESEEERSVTEGPVDEIIRPRPQGSSPVYECAAEGPGFGLPEDTAGRQAPSGRRRSWWKRQSGDPQAFSRMSHPEEATEVTLKTEVEAGASGYSVAGGGGQGIFVKQVLKGSSAAKLFSLREGDQLLSATVFFDNIKYEDALKILQYSEPYKVQFKLKRKLPAPGDVERAARGAQGTPGHTDTQDTGVADGSTDTPVRTTDTDGDQEKLLSRPGEGRGRRPQRERLSWPKFQTIKKKHGPGPRRSHSSSEAYERGKAPAASPTSSDTEAQLAAGEQGRKAGSQRRRRVLNLGFRLGAGKGPSLAGRPGGGAPGGGVWAGVLQEEGTRDDSRWDTGAAAHVGTEERREGLPDQGAEAPGASGLSTEGVLGRGADVAPRRRRRTQEGTVLEEGVSQGKPGAGPAPGQGMGDRTEGVQARETGGAVPCLQDTPVEGHMHGHQPDFRVRILDLKVPRFGISKETALAEEGEMPTPQEGPGPERPAARAAEQRDLSTDVRPDTATAVQGPHRQRAGAGKDAEGQGKALRGEAEDVEGKPQKVTMLRTRTEVLGWAPGQDARGGAEERGQRTEVEGKRHRHVTAIHLLMESEDRRGRDVTAHEGPPTITQDRGQGPGVDAEITLKDEGLTTRDSGFTILRFQMPSAELELAGPELDVALPEGEAMPGEMKGKSEEARFKIHLPKMQMPSIKVPKVDIKGPQVDIKGPKLDIKGPQGDLKGPKLDLKGAKGELAAPDVDVTLPSVEVDMQAPGAKLEGDLAVGDKEVAARDSKFKMPKFKMPSFGASAPGKSIEASVDVSLPSAHADVKTGDLSMELPAADVALKAGELGVKLPEGHVPEGELQGPAAGAGLKGHLPKMHMPSLKMPKLDIQGPQVDIKGPKLDLKGAKGELAAPDVDVTLPSVEVDMQVPGAKLEGDLAVGDKEVAARDSKFKIPKVKMPLFRSSSHKASWVLPDVQHPDKGAVAPHVLDPTQSAVVLVDYCPSTVHRDDRVPFENVEEESSVRKPDFQVSSALSPPGQSAGLSTPDMGPAVHLPGPSSATPSQVGWPGSPSDGLLVISPHAESSALPSSEGVTLTKYQMTFPRTTVVPELSQGALPESPGGAHPARSECSTGVPFWETVPLSQPDGYPGPVEHLLSTSYGRVTFPKFYQPKFRVSVPEGADAEREPRDLADALPPPSPALQGLASSAEEAPVSPRPGPELPSTGVSVPEGSEGPVGPAWTAAVAPGGCPAEHTDREGKGSSLRMPRLRLPSFRRSPKKAVEPKGAPGHGLVVDDGPAGAGTEVQVPEMDVHVDVTTAEEGAESRVKTPGFVVPKLALPTVGASTGGPGLPQGDPAAALSHPSTAGASQATPSAGGAVAGARAAEGVPEGASSDLCLPEVHLSSVSFVHADRRPAKVQVQVSQSAGGLPPTTHDLSLEAGSKGRGLGDGSVSQPGGEATDPSAEEPLPAPGQAARAAVPAPAGSMEGDPAPGSETAGSHEGWFRMPSLGLSSFWRSSKEKGEARGAAQRHAAVTSAPGQQEVPAAASGQGLQVPGSEAEAAVTPQPPEAEAEAEVDVAGVARRTLDSKRLTLHLPPAGGSAGDLPTSDVRLRPGEGSLPIQTPRGRLPETQAPPGEAGQTSAQGGQRPEGPCAPPEGPLTLKASRTHAPSPIAIVDLRQPWGDSALTVTFPKLKVPRFTFLAPGPEAGAAVFTPSVGAVWGPDSSLDPALREGCPGGWGAGDPGEQPVVHDLSPEAPPISKVRVHIQGARVESQEVTIRSRVTAGVVGLSGSQALSAQGVQASEAPVSATPTPSSAFSLLKRQPDPPAQARGPSVALGSPPPDGFQEAPQLVTLGADPGAGEPFEMIPSSLSTPGPQTLAGTPFADGCSDEEPAEILEFPPEDGGDSAPPPAAEDRAAKGKPDSRRSGLFRFWPPNIGFSSSAGDAPAAGPPEKQEKAGWFRLPKLGFSSSPPKKSDSAEHEAGLAGRKLQEEAVTFFDARESFSPEDEARGAEQGSGGRESQ